MIKPRFFFAALLAASPLPALAQAEQPSAAQIDPARLSMAKRISGKLIPDGIYKRMMSGTMDGMMKGMMDQVGEMPIGAFARIGGLSEEEVATMPKATLNEMMAIMDPAFQQRTDTMMKVMFVGMGDLMSTMEPELRDGIAEAYAKRFTAEQLADLDRFFATPTGAAYAEEQMMLMMDPAVMSRMQALMPKIMQAMPAMMGKVEAATAGLPKPRKAEDLTPAEREKLKALLGKKGS